MNLFPALMPGAQAIIEAAVDRLESGDYIFSCVALESAIDSHILLNGLICWKQAPDFVEAYQRHACDNGEPPWWGIRRCATEAADRAARIQALKDFAESLK